jgi:hypothetical protein
MEVLLSFSYKIFLTNESIFLLGTRAPEGSKGSKIHLGAIVKATSGNSFS